MTTAYPEGLLADVAAILQLCDTQKGYLPFQQQITDLKKAVLVNDFVKASQYIQQIHVLLAESLPASKPKLTLIKPAPSLRKRVEDVQGRALKFLDDETNGVVARGVVFHLLNKLNQAVTDLKEQAIEQYVSNLDDVMTGPEPRKHVSGKVQIVTCDTWEEAKEVCPWACRFQPVGKLPEQKGKWICFESDDDADVYRNLQDEA